MSNSRHVYEIRQELKRKQAWYYEHNPNAMNISRHIMEKNNEAYEVLAK